MTASARASSRSFSARSRSEKAFTDDVPGKQDSGGWFGLAQKRYERHREDHLLRHAKRTIAALLRELQRHPFDRLLIGGPDEPVALLEDHLPRPLRVRRAGALRVELFASDGDVLAAAREAMLEVERREEVQAVRGLLEAAGSLRVALGPEAVLPAISDGRVHQLFLGDGFGGAGAECPACGALLPSTGDLPPLRRGDTAGRRRAGASGRAGDRQGRARRVPHRRGRGPSRAARGDRGAHPLG